MVSVTCKRAFHDLRADVDRNPGDKWDATKERAEEIERRIPGFIEYKAKPTRRKAQPDKD